MSQTLTDRYGRTVSYDGLGNYTVTGPNGLEFSGQVAISAILGVVNAQQPAYYTPPAPPASTIVAPNVFIQRFTAAEYLAISQSYPQQLAVIINQSAINVADPLIIAAMTALAQAGKLTAARATQILSLQVTSP